VVEKSKTAEIELVAKVIKYSLPRSNEEEVAWALIRRFGSLANVISATTSELLDVRGLGKAGVAALKLVQIAAHRLAQEEVLSGPIINNAERLTRYLQTTLAREKVETLHVLFLNSKNRLLENERQARGSVNHCSFYPREILRRALELHATAVIFVHNHPSGDPTPSQDDIEQTKAFMSVAKILSLEVHDHIIVGNGRILSFRQAGLIHSL